MSQLAAIYSSYYTSANCAKCFANVIPSHPQSYPTEYILDLTAPFPNTITITITNQHHLQISNLRIWNVRQFALDNSLHDLVSDPNVAKDWTLHHCVSFISLLWITLWEYMLKLPSKHSQNNSVPPFLSPSSLFSGRGKRKQRGRWLIWELPSYFSGALGACGMWFDCANHVTYAVLSSNHSWLSLVWGSAKTMFTSSW